MSRRQDILAELVTRIEGILVADGYQTNIGQLVFVGERPVLGPDDPDASLDVVVRADQPGHQGENVFVTLPVDLHAIVKAGVVGAWATIEAILADVKRAVEVDHDLGGLLVPRGLVRGAAEPRDREPGDEIVGASLRYELQYVEQWGQP